MRGIRYLLEGEELAAVGVHVLLVDLVREHEQLVLVRELYDRLDVVASQHLPSETTTGHMASIITQVHSYKKLKFLTIFFIAKSPTPKLYFSLLIVLGL